MGRMQGMGASHIDDLPGSSQSMDISPTAVTLDAKADQLLPLQLAGLIGRDSGGCRE